MPTNLGVAGGWNLIIKSFLKSPYWIIVNHDVSFQKGFLHEMYYNSLDTSVGIIHGKSGDFDLGSFDLFLIRDWVIESHGLFDENFYPAYCEDCDYIMKLFNNPVKTIKNLEKKYYHGSSIEYYDENGGQNTKKENKLVEEKLNIANTINYEYMNKKWGKDWRNCNPYKTPFNLNTDDLKLTTYNLNFNIIKFLE